MNKEFGIYVDVEPTEQRDKYNHRLYKARCSICGAIVYRKLNVLQDKNKICAHQYVKSNINNPRLRNIFSGMKNRCFNSNDHAYNVYGGKGIGIDWNWIKDPTLFEEWALENGYKDDLTIDRIDSNGDYCPSNCRWITLKDNTKYKSSTHLIEVDGVKRTGRDWALLCGLGINRINIYMRQYSHEDVIKFISSCIKNGLPKRAYPQQSYIDAFLHQQQ